MGVVLLTLTGEWVSVALRLHAEAWTATTGALIAGLALVTVLGVAAALALRRAGRAPVWQAARAQPDWLADAIALGERGAARLGRWRDLALAVLRWLDDEVVARVRLHPLLAAAVFSLLFAMAIDAAQIVLEGYTPALALLFVAVSACSVFAFVVIIGAYRRVVGRDAGSPSRAVLATIVASAAVPLAAAFRGSLWWLAWHQRARRGPHATRPTRVPARARHGDRHACRHNWSALYASDSGSSPRITARRGASHVSTLRKRSACEIG